jgi:hypothetical protein
MKSGVVEMFVQTPEIANHWDSLSNIRGNLMGVKWGLMSNIADTRPKKIGSGI